MASLQVPSPTSSSGNPGLPADLERHASHHRHSWSHGHHHGHKPKQPHHHGHHGLKGHHSSATDTPGFVQRVETAGENTLTKIKSLVVSRAEIKRGADGQPLVEHVHGKRVVEKKPAHAFGGHCAGNVLGAIRDGGINVQITDAKDAGPSLQRAGFKPVDEKNYKPLAGDVQMIAAVGDHKNGHLAIFTGNPPKGCGWVSDAIQGADRYPLRGVSDHTQAAHSTYFRHPQLAAQALKLNNTGSAGPAAQTKVANAAPSGVSPKFNGPSAPAFS